MAKSSGDIGKFKQALDKQNQLERSHGGAKKQRDAVEGEAAKQGLSILENESKGRPKRSAGKAAAGKSQKASTRKSPQAARSQPR